MTLEWRNRERRRHMRTLCGEVDRRAGMAVCLVGMVLIVAAPDCVADTAEAERIKELERRLERSLAMIEALQKRVQQIESAGMADKAASVASSPAADQAGKIESLERQMAQLGSGLAMRQGDTGVPVHGFADVGLRRSGENNPAYGKGRKGFNVGTFDLYFTPQFGDRVRMLAEPNIEVDAGGSTQVDLERLQIGYVVSDALTAWAGRFHTPVGYWNTAFHHGAQIQTSVLRPRFLDFEDKGGILPVHTTGVWLTGAVPAGGHRLGYDLYAGNSQRIRTDAANPVGPGGVATGALDMKMAGSGSANTVAGFNAWMSPGRFPDLRLGVHGLRGDIAAVDGNESILDRSRLQMLGGYGVFANDNWEIMGEYYRFNNRDIGRGTATHASSAWYGQAGYSIGLYTPYVRLERTALDQGDPYFAYQTNGRSYRRVSFGLRYEADPRAALKLEVDGTRKRDLVDARTGLPVAADAYGEAYVQYSVRF